MSEVLTLEDALRRRAAARALRQTYVFTNGCFDVIHPGHVALLHQARRLGHYLMVAINSDRSVRELKGPGRPLQDEAARAIVLAALQDVDGVVVFDEETPLELIRKLEPDVLVKGATTPRPGGRAGGCGALGGNRRDRAARAGPLVVGGARPDEVGLAARAARGSEPAC
jgi:rfaE bifunctional protein nucleotidyltransferase chain/domain